MMRGARFGTTCLSKSTERSVVQERTANAQSNFTLAGRDGAETQEPGGELSDGHGQKQRENKKLPQATSWRKQQRLHR
jgi:hypothetical protein